MNMPFIEGAAQSPVCSKVVKYESRKLRPIISIMSTISRGYLYYYLILT